MMIALSPNARLVRCGGLNRPARGCVAARPKSRVLCPAVTRAQAVRPTTSSPQTGATGESPRTITRATTLVQDLTISGSVLEIGSMEEFEDALHQAGEALVVLDITSSTCGPCRFIYPKFVEMSKEFTDGAVFLKLIGNQSKDTLDMVKEMGVKAVPEFRFFRAGELLDKFTGCSEQKLRMNIEAHI